MDEDINDSDFIDMIAYWFEIEDLRGNCHFGKKENDCSEKLKQIAARLDDMERWSEKTLKILKNIKDPDPIITKLIDDNFWSLGECSKSKS